MKSNLVISFILLFVATTISSQTINFQNPSFEGTPQPHVTPTGWVACMTGYTPDTQPGSWGITLLPSNGSSHVGLVHQASSGWQEGVGQLLSIPLQSGLLHSFSIDLATTSVSGSGIIPGCAELQLWGGMSNINTGCDKSELLWTSGDIYDAAHIDQWVTHQVTFTPTQNWDEVLFVINSLGCTDGPYIMLDNINPGGSFPMAAIQIIQQPSCLNSCDASANAFTSDLIPPLHYLWSTGDTTSSVNNLCPGQLMLEVSDSSGTVYYDTVNIVSAGGLSPQPPVDVCIVSFDTATEKNIIIWEKPVTAAIDSFYIRRESLITYSFETIGKTAYSDMSTFIDLTSQPNLNAECYRIIARDTCGRFTSGVSYHRTIYLSVSPGIGGSNNLLWTPYIGYSFSTYLIFRGTSYSNLTLLTAVPATDTSYTDAASPPDTSFYCIVAQKSTACYPSAKILSGYFSTYSNITNGFENSITDHTDISTFSVKPNPANDYFNIELNQPKYLGADFMLLDVAGRLVYSTKINETNTKVSLQGINSGVYIGQIAKEGLPASSVRIVVSESFR